MQSFYWFLTVALLVLLTLGISGTFYVLAATSSFVIGILLAFYYQGKEWELQGNGPTKNLERSPIGLPGLAERVAKKKATSNWDRRLTGSSSIDKPLQDVLEYALLDYIQPWYKQISDTDDFIRHAHMSVQKMIINFTDKSKSVDWVPYFTTRLVDDFASHLRLFRRTQQRARQKSVGGKSVDLDSIFFDLELEMEETMCRDGVCTNPDKEKQYLREVTEVLLFLLLPPRDFHNKALRYILREVIVNALFLPMINLFSDPDYVTYNVAWLCSNESFTSESFLAVIKMCRSQGELGAVADKLEEEVHKLRARDSGGADDIGIKQQLSSLRHVQKLVEERCSKLASGAVADEAEEADLQRVLDSGQKLYQMPFADVLSNNVALAKFQEFLELQNTSQYMQFYLDATGYRLAAETMLAENADCPGVSNPSELAGGPNLPSPSRLSQGSQESERARMCLRDSARSIYQNHLQETQVSRVHIADHIRKRIWHRICTEQCDETLFDEARERVYSQLQQEPFYPSFQKHILYVRTLLQLNLLEARTRSHESLAMESLSEEAFSDSVYTGEADSREDLEFLGDEQQEDGVPEQPPPVTLQNYSARIVQMGIASDHGQKFALYQIGVTRHLSDGSTSQWEDVFRRYSDFHDLHMFLRDKFEGIASQLQLPGKRVFNNTDAEFLEKRRLALDDYLQCLLRPDLLSTHPKLADLLAAFLSSDPWEKTKTQLQRKHFPKLDSVVNPVVSAAKNVATGLDRKMDSVLGSLDRLLASKQRDERGKVGAGLDEDSSNIPLRILLLMLNELFDLRHQSQWFRRKMMAILKQLISTFSGDNINKRIVEQVEWLMSTEQVADYIRRFRDALWPQGCLAEKRSEERTQNDKLRTAILCRAKLLGSVPEELSTVLGSDAVRRGIQRLFDMLQQPTMNRRLLYVLLEASLQTMFPDNKFAELFRKIHEQSTRVQHRAGSSTASKQKSRKITK